MPETWPLARTANSTFRPAIISIKPRAPLMLRSGSTVITARSCASTAMAPSRPITRSMTAPGPTSMPSGRAACAIPSASRSTPPTGRMYIGDVGSNSTTTSIEELNLGVAGANYGWPICEGTCSTAGMTNPFFSYGHNGLDASIIAGFVYHGTQFPADYQNSFFYADYAQRWIKRLTFDANGNVTGNLNFEPADGSVYGPYGDIVDLKMGPDGALYYADIALDNNGNVRGPGTVRRIRYI